MKSSYMKHCLAAMGMLLTPLSLMAIEKEGEYYVISSPENLIEFAQIVNAGDVEADCYLTADIDMRGHEADFPLIGTAENPFCGDFDGRLHTITINLESTGESCGLFAHLCGNVKNLYLDGTLKAKYPCAGSIAGTAYFPALIEQCHSRMKIIVSDDAQYVGGLVGCNMGVECPPPYIRVQNCIFSGQITGFEDLSPNSMLSFVYSGIVGYAKLSTRVNNCLVSAKFDSSGIVAKSHFIINAPKDTGYGQAKNCYCVFPDEAYALADAEAVTMDQIESGEVCYLLNIVSGTYGSPVHQTVFRQNIGQDKYPVYNANHGLVTMISSTGYAGWSPARFNEYLDWPSSVDCHHVRVPQGVKAYAGTVKGESLLLHPVEVLNGTSWGNNGYVLKGKPGYYSFIPTNEQPTTIKNDLDGSRNEIMSGNGYYLLDEKDGVVGFYQIPYGVYLESNTAYTYDTGVYVDMLPFVFDGDVNSDGEISVTDVGMLISYILGMRPEGFNEDAADVNGDGEITVTDVGILITWILESE